MEFHYCLQTNINMNTHPNHEHEYIDEDDVFYADLRRQILLLTADDDEDCQETKNSNNISAHKRGSSGFSSSALQPGNYFNWWENEKTNSVPTWLDNLWRSSNGTGVFIPHIIKSRRRNRPRMMNNERRRMYTRVEKK